MPRPLIAGIEAGGTKMICALAKGGEILAQTRIPTRAPGPTFAAIENFFLRAVANHGQPEATGVASFGPLDLDPRSPNYGTLTTTPKPGWSGTNMRKLIEAAVRAPTVIDTDVNCAGLAETRYGAGQSLGRVCYVTVGTGIGVGVIDNGRALRGIGHVEAGHIRVPRASGDYESSGNCPFHGNCLEGLASGPAMAARWSVPPELLADDHIGWEFEAHYLAALCINLTYTLRPERIILGGGVMAHPLILNRVRCHFSALAGGYSLDRYSADPQTFLLPPACEDPPAGLLGAIELAADFLRGGNAH